MLNTIVEGKYRVKSRLGAGAQAIVFLVEELKSGQERAMKVLTLDFRDQPLMIKRFRREFSACSRLRHPNIVKLHDFGKLEDGMHYYIMDLLPYDSLDKVLEEQSPLSEERTEKIVRQLLSAMECYHQAEVVHRDLKPANIILAPEDRPIIVDFGLVRDLTKTPMTQTGTAMGTPYYMSPEVIQGLHADHRCDIYALGVLAYQMLVGQIPFGGDDLCALFNSVLTEDPKPPSAERPSLAPKWDKIILKCLEKEPDNRFADCSSLLAALDDTEISSSGSRKLTGKNEAVLDSVATNSTKIRPIYTLPFLFFLLLLTYFFWTFAPTKKMNFSVKNLLIESAPNGLLVTWQSDAAYPTEILELKSGRRFSTEKGKPVKDHRLVIAPLAAGNNASFKICFPNGKSSLKKTGYVNHLSLKELSAHYKNSKTILSWKHEYGASAKLVLGQTKLDCLLVDGRWQVTLPDDLTGLTRLQLHFLLHDQRSVIVDMVPFIRKSVLAFNGPLARLDERLLISDLSVKMGRLLSQKAGEKVSAIEVAVELTQRYRYDKRKCIGEAIAQTVKELKLLEDYNELVAWSPLVFESEVLKLNFPERKAFFENLNKMLKLSLYSYTRKAEPRLKLSQLPKLGDFALTCSEVAEKGGQILLDSHEPPRRLTPPRYGFDLAKRSIRFSALIFNKHSFASLALHFRVRSFRNFLLQLRINDKLNLYIYDEPYLTYREKEFVTLVQQVPLEVLKEGENNFALSAVQIYDGTARSYTDLALIRMVTSKR